MNIIRIGIDLAKNSFSICGMDSHGKIVLEKTLKCKDLLSFLSNISPCIIAIEFGSGTHHWSRQLKTIGHEPKIIDSKFVIPYRIAGKIRKNDHNDAIAICYQ